MIPRYSRPAMASVWEPSNRFRVWFEMRRMLVERRLSWGLFPGLHLKKYGLRATNLTAERVARIEEIERTTRHDVIAFTTELAEHVGDVSRFIHQGMTSSDVLDTCLAVQLSQAADVLLSDLDSVLSALKKNGF